MVGFYLLNFHSHISKDTQVWGTFGDYFGGILNPLIGILNLIILIFITFQINKLESVRGDHELSVQKTIALYSLKHDALKELNIILEQVQPEFVKSDKESKLKIIFIRNNFNAFITTNSYLFPFFEQKTWESLRNSIESLADISGRYFKSNHELDIDTEIVPELSNFNNLKINFVMEVQEKILE